MKKEKCRNYRLTIAYEGTRYLGWQRLQGPDNEKTIQGILEQKIGDLLGEEISLIGSGRTDAQVHALGQVANFHTSRCVEETTFLGDMNSRLPQDIQITSIEDVPSSFHSRYDAKGKVYEYHLKLGDKPDVFRRTRQVLVPETLHIDKIRKAAKLLEGTHDFVGFSSKMTDGRSTIKTLRHVGVKVQEDEVILRFEGDGFLYHMVRIMVGTLVEIGCLKRPVDTITTVFETKNRRNAGKKIEANGLILIEVIY